MYPATKNEKEGLRTYEKPQTDIYSIEASEILKSSISGDGQPWENAQHRHVAEWDI